MAIDVTKLSQYVDETRKELILNTVLGAKSASLFNLQTGVKHQAALNLLDTTIEFGDGSDCGWDAAGTSSLSQRLLTVGQVKINTPFCEKKLLKVWAGQDVKVAAGTANLPFEQEFIKGVVDGVKQENEIAIWQGDTDSSLANLNKYDGLIKVITDSSVFIKPSETPATSVKACIDSVYTSIPVKVLRKASVCMGEDAFRTYVLALASANLYNYKPEVGAEMELVIPGTSTKVYGLAGLNGTKTVIAGVLNENIFYGVDMEGDDEKFDMWYSKDNQEFRLVINFAAGVQVAHPDEIVMYTYA